MENNPKMRHEKFRSNDNISYIHLSVVMKLYTHCFDSRNVYKANIYNSVPIKQSTSLLNVDKYTTIPYL